jgi:hypothetical protein
MSAFEQDLYEDLAYDEAEGAADLYDEDGFDGMDALDADAGDDADDWDAGDDFDGAMAFDDADDFDGDGFEAYAEADDYDDFEADEAEDLFEDAMVYALDAGDTDEFFGKLWRGIKKAGRGVARVAKRVAPVVGRVARAAAPVLGSIPTPWTQAAGAAARLLGQLRAEGASEEEALEAFAELAVQRPAAVPILAGVTARTVLKGAGRRMSPAARKQAVKDTKAAAQALMRSGGRKAVRALPKIAAAVRRQTAAKRTPPAVRTKLVKRAAAKVARSPALTQKLARPSARAKALVAGGTAMQGPGQRTITIRGPARLTISAL